MTSRVRKDRTVHARYPGIEVVRYDRAGKWYLESTKANVGRRIVTMDQAVDVAVMGVTLGGEVFFGRSGGTVFDRKVRAIQ